MTARPEFAQLHRPSLIYKAVFDGVRVGLGLKFIPGINIPLKGLTANWLPSAKMWMMFRNQAETIIKQSHILFGDFENEANISTMPTIIQYALAHPTPYFFASALDVRVFQMTNGSIAMLTAFDRGIFGKASRLMDLDRATKVWKSKRRVTLGEVISMLDTAGVDRDAVYLHPDPIDDITPWIAEKDRPAIRVEGIHSDVERTPGVRTESAVEIALKTPIPRLPVDYARLAEAVAKFKLYDYQRAGVEHLLSAESSMLSDDMGLGKTRQSIVAAHLASEDLQGLPVLVVCPASLRINWTREIRAVLPEAVVSIIGEDENEGAGWLVVSYESLGRIAKNIENGKNFAVMIVDEAHYLKEYSAARTRNAMAVADKIPRRYLLTGTPVLNREDEVHTLLKLSGHPIGALPLADFRKEYAGKQELRQQLSLRLAEWMLRRKKSDVLKDLKGKQLITVEVDPPAGFREQYDAMRADSSLIELVKINRARHMLETAKLDYISETVQSLAVDDKIIIFCQFIDSVDQLSAVFEAANVGFVTLTGSETLSRRQVAIDAFQNDATVKVFLATTDAAYAGINLTAANYVMFASLPWTPAKKAQAEDRANRNGQTRLVTVLTPIISDSIDEKLQQLLSYKDQLAGDIVGASEVDPEQELNTQRELAKGGI